MIDDSPDLQIVQATSGLDAMKLLPNHELDLIIMGIPVPDIRWCDLLRFFKHHPVHHNVPVLLISEDPSPEIRQLALKEGGDTFVQKPFALSELRPCIRRMLGKQLTRHDDDSTDTREH